MIASIQDKLRGAVGAALIVIILGYILVFGLPVAQRLNAVPSITLLSLRPPTRDEPPELPAKPARSDAVPGRAAPPNRRNDATAIVAPPPVIPPLTRSPLLTAAKAGSGSAASNGASDLPGPGEGLGGAGNGSGSGDRGDGDGNDDGDSPPRLVSGRLRFSDLPRALRDAATGGTVSVRYEVDVDGGIRHCAVIASSGNPDLDSATCELIERKFRYDPSRTPEGDPVPSTIEESHRWDVARTVEPTPPE